MSNAFRRASFRSTIGGTMRLIWSVLIGGAVLVLVCEDPLDESESESLLLDIFIIIKVQLVVTERLIIYDDLIVKSVKAIVHLSL